MNGSLSPSPAPELVFGLVAPIGVDLDLVTEVLSLALKEMSYEANEFRLTKLMREVPIGKEIVETPHIRSFKDRIAYANEVRRLLGDDALAALAISAIRAFRAEEREKEIVRTSEPKIGRGPTVQTSASGTVRAAPADTNTGASEEIPLSSRAYVIRQLKRPEEVSLLRSVYGRQFVLISAYSPQTSRLRRIEEQEQRSRGGLASSVDVHNAAYELVAQDERELLDAHGQNVRDAFALGDVFIDASSRASCEITMERFIRLLFGHNGITPTRDEYGMYMAKSASLRSSDLSRQVGSAIFRKSGEIISLGCNEVPKAGGGTYWTGDANDARDFVVGYDPNERIKTEVLVDIVNRFLKSGRLSDNLESVGDPYEITRRLLAESGEHEVSSSKIMDLIEFGRIIHAEMSAICDASRKGVATEGSILYCTTFPCHICAKHIVAAGILRVVYLEPYPKSYASELHNDSISVDERCGDKKVSFEPFVGISPYRYRDLFEKGKRKYSGGAAQTWNRGERRPMIEVYFPSYFEAETQVVARSKDKIEALTTEKNQGQTTQQSSA